MAATIDIIGVGGSSNTVVIGEASVRRFELMKDDYIRLVFSTDKKINIRLGDYITHPDWGTFYITEAQKPSYNKETGGYDYDLQFNAPYYRWNNKLYKFEPNNDRNEASWSLTDNLQSHMAVFLRNLAFHGWSFTVDASSYQLEEAASAVYIQFDNVYILDALTKIAEAFNVEWWITDSVIHFGKCESGTAIDFEVGVNVEDMQSQNSEKDAITRIYAFGSTQNIPLGYRNSDEQILLNGVVQRRLMLPSDTPYIDIEDNLAADEVVEGIVIFDDVYPRTRTTISEVIEVEKTVEKNNSTNEATTEEGATPANNEEETETVKIYRFKTNGFTFSSEYIMAGQTLQVKFESGSLKGMTFELAFNPEGANEKKTVKDGQSTSEVINPDAQLFEIVRNDNYGLMLPNETLKPAAGNEFVLLGWDANKMEAWASLIGDAEDELKDKAEAYAAKKRIDPLTYPCTMMADYMYGLNNGEQDPNYSKVGTFPAGQRIRLVNDVFFAGGSRVSRVVGFEYKLDIPYDGAIIIVGESATYSKSRATEAAINAATDSINYRNNEYGAAGGSGNVYIITSNDSTAPSEGNVYSALRSDRQYARKNRNDQISSLWTFKNRRGMRNGLQTEDYGENGSNEDNLFGKGFELITKPDGLGGYKSRLEVDELFVRIKAFFAKLEIREISYVGGNYCFSAAGSKIYYVDWIDANGNVINKNTGSIANCAKFRCYLYSDDGTTATINKWAADDQAMCRTFNIDEGVHQNVSNKYYWRRVVGIGRGYIPSQVPAEHQYEDGDEIIDEQVSTPKQYQYVDISMADCAAASDYPEAEDTIVQFGNWSNSSRQGVIYLQVEGANSPAIMEYSGVGANGNHFVLPDPTLLLSPTKNIIYGEFHSVTDGGGTTGEGDSIDDQLQALIDALNDIKNQADKKMEMWFGAYAPLPTLTNLNQSNYPASEWTTDALKALHAQDLFYDTIKEPASQRGRAWRWIAADDGEGNVIYYWEDVTDQDTIDALEKIADVASDGKLTGGAEKTRVFIDWQKAVQEYLKYKEQATDYGITTEKTAYVDAFKALGKLLNNGDDLITSDSATTVNTPAWLVDLGTETVIPSPTDYRTKWNNYYTTLAALLKAIAMKAKELADAAQADATTALNKIGDMGDDGKLDPSEKLTVKREFIAAYHEMMDTDESGYASGILDMAKDSQGAWIVNYNTWIAPYINAFRAVGTYLNGGTSWTEPTLANFGDSTLPAWLKDANMGNTQTITGSTWRNLWAEFYATRTAVLNALTEHAQGTADEALEELDNIAADNVLTEQEKLVCLREWDAAKAETTSLVALVANIPSISSTALSNAFNILSNYLNNLTENNTTAFTGTTPALLITAGNTTINGTLFKTYWRNYYDARSSLLASASSSKMSVFVQDERPNPPYKEGDIWVQTANDNNMMLCIVTRLAGATGYESDWADMSDLTEKRDPRILIAALANMVYNYAGGYIRAKSSNQYLRIFFAGTPTTATQGDIYFNGTDVYQWGTSWSQITNETLRMACKALYDVVGNYTFRIFRTRPSITPQLYDIVCSTISFTDTNLPSSSPYRTVEGGIQIQYYDGSDWEILQEATRSLIENLSGYVRALAMKSAGDYSTTAGFITAGDWAELFADAEDADGNKIAQAHLSAFVTKDSNGAIQSGVSIGADQIMFTGKQFSIDADHINFVGKTVINGKFTVDANGNVTMNYFTATNATISGSITATSGKIGGFKISGNGLTNENDNGTFTNDAYIILRNDSHRCFVGIGPNVLPSYSTARALARYEIEDNDDWFGGGANIALVLRAKNNTRNYAFLGEGNGVLNGWIGGFKFTKISLTIANMIYGEGYIGLKDNNMFIVYSSVSNSGVALPKLTTVRSALGISSGNFAVLLTIISDLNSEGFVIRGRCRTEDSSGNKPWDTSELPLITHWDNGNWNDVDMGAGDSVTFLLVYDSSKSIKIDDYYCYYTARILNRQN